MRLYYIDIKVKTEKLIAQFELVKPYNIILIF